MTANLAIDTDAHRRGFAGAAVAGYLTRLPDSLIVCFGKTRSVEPTVELGHWYPTTTAVPDAHHVDYAPARTNGEALPTPEMLNGR